MSPMFISSICLKRREIKIKRKRKEAERECGVRGRRGVKARSRLRESETEEERDLSRIKGIPTGSGSAAVCRTPHKSRDPGLTDLDLRLGVRALLIIVRLIVDKKTVQQRWFPRTVELFDKERHRLETWRTGAANHRSTDRGQENSAVALVSAHGGTLRRRTVPT
ncbi:hypothetical protein EVAR_45436_1 [Eumeta japonica]|uniref:Uncharacterized protein n=1 Tax=Eumeta variegata TaxID=151549 RepID=A0A4C1YLG4_EUMVA|nr:hypothetical protein EVAR_45436_1 [Eumeta japonica]